MNPILNTAITAARQAGNTILRYVDRIDRLNVEKKGRNDFVTEVDRIAEEEIIEIIHKRYPEHRIMAEESGSEYSPNNTSNDEDDHEWIIDPLDGTTNFLHGHPDFSISIGVKHMGVIEHGVIFDPLRNELFTASKGQGAQLNNRRIRVSGQDKLKNCLIAVGYPSRSLPNFDIWLKLFNEIILNAASIRHTGSAALDLAYVACGRTDAFFEPRLKQWDIAAGSLIVREARGLVADFDGEQNYLENGDIVCANPRIFNDLLSIIKTNTTGLL